MSSSISSSGTKGARLDMNRCWGADPLATFLNKRFTGGRKASDPRKGSLFWKRGGDRGNGLNKRSLSRAGTASHETNLLRKNGCLIGRGKEKRSGQGNENLLLRRAKPCESIIMHKDSLLLEGTGVALY